MIVVDLKLNKRQGFHNALEDAKITARAFQILLDSNVIQMNEKIIYKK